MYVNINNPKLELI